MNRVFLLTVGVLLIANCSNGQDNPFLLNKVWEIELIPAHDVQNAALEISSTWATEDRWNFLVRTRESLIVADESEVTSTLGESYQINSAVTYVDFGNDLTGIVVASNGPRTASVTWYFGEFYREYMTVEFSLEELPQGWTDQGIRTNFILQMADQIPDRRQQVIVGFTRNANRYLDDGFGNSEEELAWWGESHLVSFADSSNSVLYRNGFAPESRLLKTVRFDREQQYGLVRGSSGSVLLDFEHGPQGQSQAGIYLFMPGHNEPLLSRIELNYRGGAIATKHFSNEYFEIIVAREDGIESYSSRTLQLQNSNDPDIVLPTRMFYCPGIREDQDYLLTFSANGRVQLIDYRSFELISSFQWTPDEGAIVDVECANFDEDEYTELLILTTKTLVMYKIRAWDVNLREIANSPSHIDIDCFPNPFNSSTTINYSLPKPGRYALDVVDISGRLVARLSDGWREAGSYREVWDGHSLVSGEYNIILYLEEETLAKPVTFIK